MRYGLYVCVFIGRALQCSARRSHLAAHLCARWPRLCSHCGPLFIDSGVSRDQRLASIGSGQRDANDSRTSHRPCTVRGQKAKVLTADDDDDDEEDGEVDEASPTRSGRRRPCCLGWVLTSPRSFSSLFFLCSFFVYLLSSSITLDETRRYVILSFNEEELRVEERGN